MKDNNNSNIKKIESNLKKYIDEKIKKELEKTNKKLIREKSKKILFRNIIILILSLIIIFLLYLLKSVHYFDKFFIETVPSNVVEEPIKKDNTQSLDQLIETYGYLIDNVFINEKSEYISDYYSGNLTDELKKYISLNSIDLDKCIENDYTLIDNSLIKSNYNKLFNQYTEGDFKYNNETIKYIAKLDSYLSNNPLKNNKTNIIREIISINISDYIYITTVEGIIKDGKIYNIVSGKEIGDYKDNLKKFKDYLNTITYKFNNNILEDIMVD